MAEGGAKVRLANVYILREARTPKACGICRKPTVYVLSSESAPMLDNMYICGSHTSDRALVTRLDAGKAPGPSTEDVDRVVKEWKDKQVEEVKAKHDDRASDKDNSAKDKSSAEDKAGRADQPEATAPAVPSVPIHGRFALHREFYAQRVRQLMPRKAPAPAFPTVPGGVFH